MAGVTKLAIIRCDVDDTSGKVTPNNGNKFEALINPESLEHSFGIRYSDKSATPINGNSEEKKYAGYEPETVSFSLVFDGTGVVPPANPSLSSMLVAEPTPVATLLKKLKSICYTYQGENHEPNVVQLVWGKNFTKFYARVQDWNVNYTLFKPTGDPLRAKMKLKFVRYQTNEENAAESNNSSPDLTHAVIVKEGDTLPLLCDRIYRDGGLYLDVARYNGLTDFRQLKPNTVLHFPPLPIQFGH